MFGTEGYNKMNYYFYDTDLMGQDDYDIRGESYRELIDVCCRFSTSFSLALWDKNSPVALALKEYEIKERETLHPYYRFWSKQKNGWSAYVVCYYRVCEETCQILKDITESVFDWCQRKEVPGGEDPSFYREDGSIFFSSEIHDGFLHLAPLESESPFDRISPEHWTKERREIQYNLSELPKG